MPQHIHQALAQVQALRRIMIERQLFRGYSALARFSGGVLALCGAFVMSSRAFPQTLRAHLLGWGVVCLASVTFNYVALARWYFSLESSKRELNRLRPAVDALVPLAVGAIFSGVFVWHGLFDFLFGCWMCIFGLTNIASRHALPEVIWHVGCYYIVAGVTMFLLIPYLSFLNPWPMGLVFFVGESAGAYVLCGSVKNLVLSKKARIL